MTKQFLSKILPVLSIASFVAFVYVNLDSKCSAVCMNPEQVLLEQARIDADRESEKEVPSVSTGILAKTFALAQRFLPVSNHFAD